MPLFIFLLILVALVVVHELGHFFAAKLFGIKVEEFGVFFPPRIKAWRFGETEYSLNSLPFGGFVRIFGEEAVEGETPLLPQEARKSFAHRSRTVQAVVLAAGIVCNLLFAWLVLSVGYMVGLPTSVEHKGFGTVHNAQVMIVSVFPGSPAQSVGIKPGDVVLAAQTATASLAPSANAATLQQFIADHPEQSIVLSVLREKTQENFVARPTDGLVVGRKAIGIELDDVGVLKLSPPVAFLQGALTFWEMTRATAVGLATFFATLLRGTANLSQVSGPIGIAGIGASAVRAGFAAVVVITALISINLGLLNVLPIPGLDGGRLFITAIEAVRRRALPKRLVTALTLAGFALLVLLMLVVSYHDIANLRS